MSCPDCEINCGHIETILEICADRADDETQHPNYRTYWRGAADTTLGILIYLRRRRASQQ